ncbi:SecDF P1 head subdomain-containing protein [Actinocorallia populi]|uniref:SecDF P1 head subdomain-containing protein n=1 Tax=Actinocorallia populi TaxID=2079200 RepID=UPI0013007C6F|nr:hypothetical protein [Actinocorallia populi]
MRRQPKITMLAAVVVIALCAAAVATTGVVVAAARQSRVELASPLLLYPVVQRTEGACPAGTRGVTGPEPSCYQVTEGIVIRRVGEAGVRLLRDDSHGVILQLVGADSEAFAGLTRAQRGKQIVVVVNGEVVAAPWVDSPITGGEVVITGRFTRSDAERLVHDLTGGRS